MWISGHCSRSPWCKRGRLDRFTILSTSYEGKCKSTSISCSYKWLRGMECAVCDWYDPPSHTDLGGANVMLVADCVWLQELVKPLLKTLKKLTANGNVRVIISYQRRGRSAHEEFRDGLHSIFSFVHYVDPRDTGLKKPDCLYLLECSHT